MKGKTEYLTLKDAAKMGKKDDFFKNVKEAVIPKLIEKGKLHGKSEQGKQLVANDEAFQKFLQTGIESFVYDMEAWCFTAIKAPMDEIAKYLKKRTGVTEYRENIKPAKLSGEEEIEPDADQRHVFLVKTKNSEWPVLIQTVHWIESSDMFMSLLLAAELSGVLKTTAVSAWDDDFSGSTLIVCENGEKTNVLADESSWEDFYLYFHEANIYLPNSFISIDEDGAALSVEKPAEIERADYLRIAIPSEDQASGPHVFYKLEMMAKAAAGDFEDEEDFMAASVEGLWQNVQRALKSR